MQLPSYELLKSGLRNQYQNADDGHHKQFLFLHFGHLTERNMPELIENRKQNPPKLNEWVNHALCRFQ